MIANAEKHLKNDNNFILQKSWHFINRYGLKLIGLISFIIIWELLAQQLGATRLPHPKQVLSIFIKSINSNPSLAAQGGGSHGFLPHILYSVKRYFSGVLIGIITGVATGLIMARSKFIKDVFELPLELFRAIPPLAAIPFFLMWFGTGALAQTIILALYCFLMIVVNANNAIKNINPIYKKYSKTLGASENQILKNVTLPAIIPELIGGIRVALAISWGIQVVVELLGAPYGIGKVFSLMVPIMALDLIIVGILWISIFAIITDTLFTLTTRKYFSWKN